MQQQFWECCSVFTRAFQQLQLQQQEFVIIIGLLVMFVIGCWRQMMLNWVNISQVTGLPTALFYLAGVTGGGLMILVAIGQIFGPVPYGAHSERSIA